MGRPRAIVELNRDLAIKEFDSYKNKLKEKVKDENEFSKDPVYRQLKATVKRHTNQVKILDKIADSLVKEEKKPKVKKKKGEAKAKKAETEQSKKKKKDSKK